MSTGLIALLDDVAALAKVAAASVDDVVGYAAKAGAKSAGLVIDDTAVTPRYVVGFSADRELPIIAKIAVGSLRNKLLFLLPVALALGVFAPWAITPLLMLGGAYLSFEGAEKIWEAVSPHHGPPGAEPAAAASGDPEAVEAQRVASAIRTDFILSAEIMAITLYAIPATGFWPRATALALVGIGITAGVYGAVALLVKADDLGVLLGRNRSRSALGALGRWLGLGIVRAMPVFFELLTIVGTGAMLWVGGGIVLHGLEGLGVPGPAHALGAAAGTVAGHAPVLSGVVEWTVGAAGAGLAGLMLGGLLLPLVFFVLTPLWGRVSALWR